MPDTLSGLLAWSPVLTAFLVGYVLGSIPFGLLLTQAAGLGDIRRVGSGNIGATNVLRTGKRGLAAATLIFDALKGTVAVLAMAWLFDPPTALPAALGAFLGHLFPVWLGFKGGKGVATFIGCLIGLKPLAALVFAGLWLAVAYLTRYSSLSALIASAAMPPLLWALGEGNMAVLAAILAALLWWKHAPNLRRLRAGQEGKIGQNR